MIHRMTFERGRSFLAVLILVAAGQAWAEAGTPGVDAESADVDAEIVRTVEHLHATMLSVMKDSEALGYAGRYERLEPVVRS